MDPGVHTQVDIDRAVAVVASKLADLCRVSNRVLVAQKSGVIMHTRLQAIFNLKFETRLEQSVHEIIVGHAYSAEKLGPGAFDTCVELLLEKLAAREQVSTHTAAKVNSSDLLGAGAGCPTRSDVEWALAEHMAGASSRTRLMLERALDLAGFAGRVIVEKARSRPSVELVRGYTFDQAPAWPIKVRLERPRIVCIDGYVEAVSELHHLLEAAAQTKESVVLFARGMSDDVKHTLKVNYDRGSLRVIPIIVAFDLDGLNTINDIAVATGAGLVSSHKGDLISSVKLSEAPHVEEVIVHPNKVSVTNSQSRRAVQTQVAFLREKRSNATVDDVGKLFDARIRALSPNHVVIRLPDDIDYVSSAQSIDYALRAVRALIDHGTTVIDGKKALAVTLVASHVHSDRCLSTLASLGAAVHLSMPRSSK